MSFLSLVTHLFYIGKATSAINLCKRVLFSVFPVHSDNCWFLNISRIFPRLSNKNTSYLFIKKDRTTAEIREHSNTISQDS